jgi:hypothetical protein
VGILFLLQWQSFWVKDLWIECGSS